MPLVIGLIACGIVVIVLAVVLIVVLGNNNNNTPMPTPTPEVSATIEPTATPNATPTPTIEPTPEATPEATVAPTAAPRPAGGMIDMTDQSHFFIEIDGVTFNPGIMTLGDALDLGATLSSFYDPDSLNGELEPFTYTYSSLFDYGDFTLSMSVYNPTGDTIDIKDALIGQIEIEPSDWGGAAALTDRVVLPGGIKFGAATPEEVLAAFTDEPYYEYKSDDGESMSYEWYKYGNGNTYSFDFRWYGGILYSVSIEWEEFRP